MPKVRIGHNVSNAKINSDGTFTDDYTRTFEDMVVKPRRTELKRGSYSANNWNYAKAHRKDWMKTHWPSAVVDDKPLEEVYPEFDLLLGGRQAVALLNPTGKMPTKGIQIPKITSANASKITPKQWDVAYNAAINTKDIQEARRLRQLHFKTKAPESKVIDINGNPILVLHKTPETFNTFDTNKSVGKVNWFASLNAFGENGVFATGAGSNPRTMKLYVNMKNPHIPTIEEGIEPAYIEREIEDGILGIVDKDMTNYFNSAREAGPGFMMSGGVDNAYALKSANIITYDNAGNIIPLSKRDNFSINDIRYLLPFAIGGGIGYGLYNSSQQ